MRAAKFLDGGTLWSNGDLPPRHAPYLTRTRPIKAGWRWRSARASNERAEFVIVAMGNAKRDKWQAILAVHNAVG